MEKLLMLRIASTFTDDKCTVKGTPPTSPPASTMVSTTPPKPSLSENGKCVSNPSGPGSTKFVIYDKGAPFAAASSTTGTPAASGTLAAAAGTKPNGEYLLKAGFAVMLALCSIFLS